MSVHTTVDRIGRDDPAPAPLPRPLDVYLARVDRGIEEAEQRLEEQHSRIAQAAAADHNTAQDQFDLQKMQLILAILREGRERLLQRMRASRQHLA